MISSDRVQGKVSDLQGVVIEDAPKDCRIHLHRLNIKLSYLSMFFKKRHRSKKTSCNTKIVNRRSCIHRPKISKRNDLSINKVHT